MRKRKGLRAQQAAFNHTSRELQTAADRSIRAENTRLRAACEKAGEALLQAEAALPDAWFAVKCNVPREVVELVQAAREEVAKALA